MVCEMRVQGGVASLIVAGLIVATPAGAAINDTTLISRAPGASGAGGNADSDHPTISADGRYVDFDSDASNFDLNDEPAYTDVFERDRVANSLSLASMSTARYAGDGYSSYPSLSDDGLWVAFESNASNLGGTPRAANNIYLRDWVHGTTRLVSLTSGGVAADASSTNPAVSASGRYVAFQSEAENLSGTDRPVVDDIFVRDVRSGKTTLVSVSGARVGGNQSSFHPSISGNGCRIAFVSDATNLAAGGNRGVRGVYVRDRCRGTTELVSRASGAGGAVANLGSFDASISPDGRYVAFGTRATNLSPLSKQGVAQVYLRDLAADKTILISRASGAAGAASKGDSTVGSIRAVSSNGARVIFESHGDNLSAQDNDSWLNVYVRDLRSATTTLVSRASGASGRAGNYGSSAGTISANGRFAAFSSDATNLAAGSKPNAQDVFARDLGLP